ncbi:MAG TPA: DUF2267 domain-containing protein [Baekduia sp.]|nr:DUF2267 domain-containing protein [Baekduia sp.]
MATLTTHLFDHAVTGAATWIDELSAELRTDDPREARRVLRAVLHAVRDRLEPNEAAQLAAQMPELVRGIYYEDWVPGRRAPRHRDEFLRAIAHEGRLAGATEASFAAAAVMRVLRAHISEGEIADVLGVMPSELRELLDA